jgi:hypothetical protein
MIRLLRVIVILAILLAGFGFYRGWFRVHSNGESTVKLRVDTDKINQDNATMQQKVQGLANK